MSESKPFHVEGLEPLKMKVLGINIFPAIIKAISLLPDETRKKMSTKQHASGKEAMPYDQLDCLGSNPYKTEEVKEGKIWRVTYATENKSLTGTKDKKAAKGFGMDWTSEDIKKKILAGAATEGEKALELAPKDLLKMAEWWQKTDWKMEERFQTSPMKFNSFIVKLTSGSLLLYAPVRVRDEVDFGSWLDGLGKVEWVVVASSFHTLFLTSVLERYPEAKVIGASQAQDKLNHVGALVRKKFDYNSTVEEELSKANEELQPEGVQLHLVKGDVCTNVLLAVAHGVLLSCDLTYINHNGGIFDISQEEFDKYKEEDTGLRMFKYLNCNKPNSPNGFLAKYRFMFMDHTGMGKMRYEQPARDGSSCTAMATALRAALSLEWDFAMGVHFKRMDREDYRKTVDANWNWLDGKSLL